MKTYRGQASMRFKYQQASRQLVQNYIRILAYTLYVFIRYIYIYILILSITFLHLLCFFHIFLVPYMCRFLLHETVIGYCCCRYIAKVQFSVFSLYYPATTYWLWLFSGGRISRCLFIVSNGQLIISTSAVTSSYVDAIGPAHFNFSLKILRW